MEVLDSVQTICFKDDFMDIEPDIHRVLFICTINSLDIIFHPLLDRLEGIEVAGQTALQKEYAFMKYIKSQANQENGLTDLSQTNLNSHLKLFKLYLRAVNRKALKLGEESQQNVNEDRLQISKGLGLVKSVIKNPLIPSWMYLSHRLCTLHQSVQWLAKLTIAKLLKSLIYLVRPPKIIFLPEFAFIFQLPVNILNHLYPFFPFSLRWLSQLSNSDSLNSHPQYQLLDFFLRHMQDNNLSFASCQLQLARNEYLLPTFLN